VGSRGEGYRLTTAISTPDFVNMVRGVYPSFSEAMDIIRRDDVYGVAFSRQYALTGDNDLDGLVYLYHKQNKVGFLMDDKITLSKKMTCLKEQLSELGLRL
jgi:hypothetical protein